MKKFLLIVLVLFSCQNKAVKEKENLEKNLFTYFKETLNNADSTVHLDSIRIIKFDTITAKTLLLQKINSIYDLINDNQKDFDKALENRNDAKQMLRLTAGLSSALYNNSLDDYKKNNEEMIAINKKDSLLMKTADSLTETLKITDSTTLLYLQATCIMQYKRKDLSVSRDTAYGFFDREKNIVRKEDILK